MLKSKENNFNRKCIIIELSNTGHRVNLSLDLNVKAAINSGYSVEILTHKDSCNSEEFAVFKGNHPNIEITSLSNYRFKKSKSTSNPFRLLLIQSFRVNQIEKILDTKNFELVVFNTFDDFIYGFYLLKTNYHEKIRALYISPKMRFMTGVGLRNIKNFFSMILFNLASKKFKAVNSIIIIDEIFQELINKSAIINCAKNKVQLINDVGEIDRVGDKTNSNRNNADFIILVYGSLTVRKGIEPLLRSLSNNIFDFKIEIIFAGVPDKEVKKILSSYNSPENVILNCQLGYVSKDLESRLFNNCDIVWLGYLKRFISSSGVLYQALSARKPVISCSHGLIGNRVNMLNVGITVDIEIMEDIRSAIEILSQKNDYYNLLCKNAEFASKMYTKNAFVKSLMNSIYA